MTQQEILEVIVKALDSKRAEDIQVLHVGELTILGDYFIIANGTSTTHTKTLADEVEYQLSERGLEPMHREGRGNGSCWIMPISLCIFSIRKPVIFTSWNASGRTASRWTSPLGRRQSSKRRCACRTLWKG